MRQPGLMLLTVGLLAAASAVISAQRQAPAITAATQPASTRPATAPATTQAASPKRQITMFTGISLVEITEDDHGIQMTVTTQDESTESIVLRYKAANVQDLARQSTEAHHLYLKALATTRPAKNQQ